jgi:hypothetical protein
MLVSWITLKTCGEFVTPSGLLENGQIIGKNILNLQRSAQRFARFIAQRGIQSRLGRLLWTLIKECMDAQTFGPFASNVESL